MSRVVASPRSRPRAIRVLNDWHGSGGPALDARLHLLKIFQGGLNTNFLLRDQWGANYVLRIPLRSPKTHVAIQNEYRGIGYCDDENGYRYRTLDEQAAFSKKCLALDIPVARTFFHTREYLVSEFIRGKTLSAHLRTGGDPYFVKDHVSFIMRAHQSGIIVGDRWGPNEMVTPQNTLRYIDFDIELKGKRAREFEMAQVLYHAVAWAKDKERVSRLLVTCIERSTLCSLYDTKKIAQFLQGHQKYFRYDQRYTGSVSGVGRIIHSLTYLIFAFY